MALHSKYSVNPSIAGSVTPGPQTMSLGPLQADPLLIPDDAQFYRQWHLNNPSGYDLNVTAVWDDYTGAGVTVGTIDTGVDYLHADLAPNYQLELDRDLRDGDSDAFASAGEDRHGTAVTGVIGAALGGGDAVGVAYGADITSLRIAFGAGSGGQEIAALYNAGHLDIVNKSWGYSSYFYDNFSTSFSSAAHALSNLVSNGRDGLGTIVTFSAGNGGATGDASITTATQAHATPSPSGPSIHRATQPTSAHLAPPCWYQRRE